jgi:Flp pilus assembly protein TadG
MHLIKLPIPDRIRRLWQPLRDDRSGLALMEFALAFPILLTAGLTAVDVTNMAVVHMKVSQIALNLADNMSRMGTNNSLSTQQVREIDVNDAFEAVRDQGAGIRLVNNGRVILSSLENASGTQRIHWQRCIGLKSGTGYDSSYGTTATTDGIDATTANQGPTASSGLGDSGSEVTAPLGSGVMFVEVNYLHTPYFRFLFSPSRIHYIASFIVRDTRDFRQIYNPNPAATRAYCNVYGT